MPKRSLNNDVKMTGRGRVGIWTPENDKGVCPYKNNKMYLFRVKLDLG